jgi:hypothetical protein
MLKTPWIPEGEFARNEVIAMQVREHIGKVTPNRLFDFGKKKGAKRKVILSPGWIGTTFWIMSTIIEPRLTDYVTKHANPKNKNRKYILIDEMSRDEDVEKTLPTDWTEELGYFRAKEFKKTRGNGYVVGETHEGVRAKFDALLWLFFAEKDLTLWPSMPDAGDKAAWFLVDLEAQVRGIILPRA